MDSSLSPAAAVIQEDGEQQTQLDTAGNKSEDSGERAVLGGGAHRLASSLGPGEDGKGDVGDFWTLVREGSLT